MDLVAVGTIDDMGRLLIPLDVRGAKGWKKGTKIAMYIGDDYLMLDESKHDDESGVCYCAQCFLEAHG